MITVTRALVMALAISTFGLGAAYADDEYGTGRESVNRQAAMSMPGAPLSATQAKMVEKQFDYHGTYPVPATPSWGSSPKSPEYATGASIPPAMPDLVGNSGAQDERAKAIHRPGTGTDW